ncbi:MAG: GxxExxY protein [Patescibacteria group bacterium]
MEGTLKRKDLVYPELSYEVVGILFDVYNELGYGYSEKHYQRAMAESLRKRFIPFKEQVYVPLRFQGEIISKFFCDFVIDDKIIIELKREGRFSRQYVGQVNNYLKSSGVKLAILVNFGKDGVKIMRLVNAY